MISLDDTGAFGSLDKSAMLGLVDAFPDHCREGWSLGERWARDASAHRPSSLVIAGMGGSAMAGDLVRGLLLRDLPIPFVVVRDYAMPGWVGPETAVVCCSYSGETEETLSAFRHALDLGARVLVVSSGGTLRDEASAKRLSCLTVAPGLPPRAAMGYSLFGLLALIEGWGMSPPMADDVAETFSVLDEERSRLRAEVPERDNEAKALARSLAPGLPVVCAPEGHLGAVGFRWRTQLNENSKLVAYNCLFPELNHNEVAGWAKPFNVQRPVAVFLRDHWESDRNKLRMEITRELLEDAGLPVREVWGGGKSRIASMASLAYLGDYVSVYAALLRGFDPTPVDMIGLLKKRLSEGKSN